MRLSKCFRVSETHRSFGFRDTAVCSVPASDLQGVVWLNATALKVVKHAKSQYVCGLGSLANEPFLGKKSLKRKRTVLFYHSLFVSCSQHVINGKSVLRTQSSTQFGSRRRVAFRTNGGGYWIQKKCLDWEIQFQVSLQRQEGKDGAGGGGPDIG